MAADVVMLVVVGLPSVARSPCDDPDKSFVHHGRDGARTGARYAILSDLTVRTV
jgi:hypothetical protein